MFHDGHWPGRAVDVFIGKLAPSDGMDGRGVLPPKINEWNKKMIVCKQKFFPWNMGLIFRFHVKLQGCNE